MSGFALTPAIGFPPQTADEFPTGIQFQFDGQNVGGPNITTINFVPGTELHLSVGTGDDATTLTITIPSGSGLGL